jgi:MFS family permease
MATGVISGLGIGFCMYGISALFKPIASDLGLSRAIMSGAAGIGSMAGSLLAPVVGLIVDKFGPRMTILAGLLMIIAGLMLMPLVRSVLGLYLVWGLLIGIGVNLGMTLAIDKALANWFVRKIGLAMGAKFALLGLTGAIVLPFESWLIAEVGWRMACLLWAAVLLSGVPAVLSFVKNQRPEYYGLQPDGDTPAFNPQESPEKSAERDGIFASTLHRAEFGFRQAIATKAFWILSASFSVQYFITGGFNTHFIPFLTEMNFEPIAAGVMMGMVLSLTIPSRFASGFLADWIPEQRLNLLLAVPFLIQTVGLGALMLSWTSSMTYVVSISYGIAHGLPTPLLIVMTNRYFGRNAFGSIFGTFLLLGSPVALISPVLAGWLFDSTGSYKMTLLIFAFMSLSTTLLLCSLKPPTARREI